MRNKYRNRLDMHKTGGNARRLKLTSFQPVSKNLQTQAKGKVRTETQISPLAPDIQKSSLRLKNDLVQT